MILHASCSNAIREEDGRAGVGVGVGVGVRAGVGVGVGDGVGWALEVMKQKLTVLGSLKLARRVLSMAALSRHSSPADLAAALSRIPVQTQLPLKFLSMVA